MKATKRPKIPPSIIKNPCGSNPFLTPHGLSFPFSKPSQNLLPKNAGRPEDQKENHHEKGKNVGIRGSARIKAAAKVSTRPRRRPPMMAP